MANFKLVTEYGSKGDQPQAIEKLIKNLKEKVKHQVLLGVTGSGKTFTMANVIATMNIPTLVVAHNKTLAAQLYGEFKQLFPENAVEYFVSYYDYYQPEAYVPARDLYIEKEATINDEIDKMRHAATYALFERNDVIIVASVSCIYGLGSPEAYHGMLIVLEIGMEIERNSLLRKLVEIQYQRNDYDFHRGTFRVRGDTVEIFPVYEDRLALRIEFFGDTIDGIHEIDPLTGKILRSLEKTPVYPGSHYVTPEDRIKKTINTIREELYARLREFKKQGKLIEAQRLEQRTNYDLEMLETMGYCTGIENYSRHLTGRLPGQPPPTLMDYFPRNFLLFVDESHMTIPQLNGMYRGDRSRKETLMEYGFRLPSALDNRPLMFEEFENMLNQAIYVSATPSEYEIKKSNNLVVEQIIRPTGLIDPDVAVKPATHQVDDLMEEIRKTVQHKERVLVTTLTKRSAEDLKEYYEGLNIRVKYLHSDVETLERMEILKELREGKFDVLIGINLLREGLDLPEVSLVAILDADKEGFLRSARALIQTFGRAARNVNGRVVMYADTVTESMKRAIDETNRRRKIQAEYNKKHKITPETIKKSIFDIRSSIYEMDYCTVPVAGETETEYIPVERIPETIKKLKKQMLAAAKKLEFEKAAELRERIKKLQEMELTAR
ncbi:MAG TPA: excinuclease ABC subunit UvrB [bacterium]